MSRFLTSENVATRPDAKDFPPKRLAMLERIFESVCESESILSEEERDDLALNLLEASKLTRDEKTLIAVMKYDIGGYRK
jgi:hypothetical protein